MQLIRAQKRVECEPGRFQTRAATASRWHKPSQQAKANAEAVKREAQAYADRAKEQAEKLVQDERRQMQSAQRELEKQRNIATNAEAENKRLLAEVERLRGLQNYNKNNKFKLN